MSTNSNNQLRPGEIARQSGQYEIVGPRGRRTGDERTVVRGEPMPPTPKPNMSFNLVDRTKNGRR
ncbi:hypothetical protein [Microbacterium maritypicum]|uniref:YjzC family protein n=1 Tax=Microbacterium maritypicum MF109 TaxID=1333857 RepID=T5K8Y2_MICMQ|nr:hypothetical protein [Microbacterium liquefaciens]EQM78216.1 hypothetical protein L687_16955 [Microbacterium maritypicum MF109]